MTHFWHRSLLRGEEALLNSPCDLNNDLFIAWEREIRSNAESPGGSYYSYKAFTDLKEFWTFFSKQPRERQSFHEVRLAYRFQKMGFDIDIPGSDDMEAGALVVEEVIDACLKVFKKYGVKLKVEKDFILCSSHSIDARCPKLSYHLILPYYRFSSCYAVKYIFEQVLTEVSSEVASMLDAGLYNPNHMLRTLYSYKFGTRRQKEIEKTFIFHDQLITTTPPEINVDVEWLKLTLLSWTFEAKTIKVIIPQPEQIDQVEIASESVTRALKILARHDKDRVWEADMEAISGPIIPLRRQLCDDSSEKKSNKCWICRESNGQPRIHTSDNAYLLVFEGSENNNSSQHLANEGRVYFCCHRAGKEKYDLGTFLAPPKKEQLEDSDQESEEEEPDKQAEKEKEISSAKINHWRQMLTGDTRLSQYFVKK